MTETHHSSPTDARHDAIRKLWTTFDETTQSPVYSMQAIADQLGLTKGQVAGIIRRLGLHHRQPPATDPTDGLAEHWNPPAILPKDPVLRAIMALDPVRDQYSCRYPFGDPKAPLSSLKSEHNKNGDLFHYCGLPVSAVLFNKRQPYCPLHRTIVYQPPPKRELRQNSLRPKQEFVVKTSAARNAHLTRRLSKPEET